MFTVGMNGSQAKTSYLEQNFVMLLGIPIGFALFCIGYAAYSGHRRTETDVGGLLPNEEKISVPAVIREAPQTIEHAIAAPKPTPPAPTPIIAPREVTVIEPIPAVKPVTPPQSPNIAPTAPDPEIHPSAPMQPAGRVAPDPTDEPYVIPPNKPYSRKENPPPAATAPPRPAPTKGEKPPPGVYVPSSKTFVLKDGRKIVAAQVSDRGDSYSVEDISGNIEEFSKSEVYLVISRR